MDSSAFALVQASWRRIKKDSRGFMTHLCERLLDIDPGLEIKFVREEIGQAELFFDAIDQIIEHYEDDDQAPLHSELTRLGSKVADSGLGGQDYETFGEALLWAVKQCDTDYCDETETAWVEGFTEIAAVMLSAESGRNAVKAAS